MSHTQSPASEMFKAPAAITFKVYRRTPELVAPTKPTPQEFKPLSELDSQDCAKYLVPALNIYAQNPSMNGVDPVNVIRKAVSEMLVYYYPLAGRLRQDPSGKLLVECTGEGVLFIEADADVTLDQFGFPLVPPFPCLDQLLFDVPGSSEILNRPLLLIQVTRLKCGGFIFAFRYNHTMSDGAGVFQVLSAIAEMARGATYPSVLPTWERHILNCIPKKILESSLPEHKNDISEPISDLMFPPEHDLCYRTFLFGPAQIANLRKYVPHHLRDCSSFEIITACVWKCRVVALKPNPIDQVSVVWPVNLRNVVGNVIPAGYYGLALVYSVAKSTAKDILENPLSYAIQQLRNGKDKVTIDHNGSLTNLTATMRCYTVSDLRHAGLEKVDFGWGEAVYAGPDCVRPVSGYHLPFKNKNGEIGIMLPLCLPTQAMERFVKELSIMLKGQLFTCDDHDTKSKL